jgi:hypothetical protein
MLAIEAQRAIDRQHVDQHGILRTRRNARHRDDAAGLRYTLAK